MGEIVRVNKDGSRRKVKEKPQATRAVQLYPANVMTSKTAHVTGRSTYPAVYLKPVNEDARVWAVQQFKTSMSAAKEIVECQQINSQLDFRDDSVGLNDSYDGHGGIYVEPIVIAAMDAVIEEEMTEICTPTAPPQEFIGAYEEDFPPHWKEALTLGFTG